MNDDSTPRITALSPAQAARILAAAGQRRITEAMVLADIEAGAPTNADGTLNLIHYIAWLSWQAGDRAQEAEFDPAQVSSPGSQASSLKPQVSTERSDHGD